MTWPDVAETLVIGLVIIVIVAAAMGRRDKK